MKRPLKNKLRKLREAAAAIPAGIETKEGTAPDIVGDIKSIGSVVVKMKTMIDEMKTDSSDELTELKTQHSQLQRQVDALDANLQDRVGGVSQGRVLVDRLKEDDGLQNFLKVKRGSTFLTLEGDDHNLWDRKTTIDSPAVGSQTTGVLRIDRVPGIIAEARQRLFLRNLLTSRPTTLGIVDAVRVNAAMAIASMQLESSAKLEVGQTYTAFSEKVGTVAAVVPASMQVLDDFAELAGFISTSLAYSVNQREEAEFLWGSGVGNDLHGIGTQATAFNTSLVTGAWSKLELIAAAIAQVAIAKEIPPTFCILNPADWLALQRIKTTTGEFILGNPQDQTTPRIWGLDVLPTTNMSSGMFLVGNGSPDSIEIRDRLSTTIEISREHQDFFVKNLVMFRCEKRTCLIVKRPGAYILGSLTTSP